MLILGLGIFKHFAGITFLYYCLYLLSTVLITYSMCNLIFYGQMFVIAKAFANPFFVS